ALNARDLAAVGWGMVTVFTPGPGGGSSSPVPLTIVPAPILTVSATSVSPGAPITVTMTGGLNGESDWIAIAPTTAPDTTYVSYLYVKGVNGSWTFTAPTAPGTYQFRLYLNNSYSRAATSPSFTVGP